MSTTVWKGSINLGLLSIPVKLYCAARESRISLNQLHKDCNTRIKMPKSCPTCDQVMGNNDLVKGYEYEKGKFVIITDAEIEAIAPVSTHIMDVGTTVKMDELDPLTFGDSYYIVPDVAGRKAYALLLKALKKNKTAAIARMSKNQREMVMVIRPFGMGLVCHAMYYPEEVREVPEFEAVTDVPCTDAEERLASELLASLEGPFQPEDYEDGFQARLKTLLDAKQKGGTVDATPTPADMPSALDLLSALQASLDASNRRKGTGQMQVEISLRNPAEMQNEIHRHEVSTVTVQ